MPVVCSISGFPPEDPVVSKHGYVFERRLIEQVITESGRCPVTGDSLSLDDIRPIVPNSQIKALPVDSATLPDLMRSFQDQWDRLMTDSFELKSQLDSAKEELAQSLYEREASMRLVAELTKERDTAMAEISRLQEELANLHYSTS